VVAVGFLFQPRRRDPVPPATAASGGTPLTDRLVVFRLALEASVIGDTSRFGDYFTEDLTFTSPHLAVTSRESAQRSFGGPEYALTDVRVVERSVESFGDTLFAEWVLEATFSGPLLFGDDLLVEPTGGHVHLRGASVAEFRGARIAEFRHYFDDSELLDGVPGVPPHVRWRRAVPGPPST
jgi:ketosteroid isomerase-like protein